MGALGYAPEASQVREGLAGVIDLTGIKGRWQVLGENPLVICDTGHNRPAMEYILTELGQIKKHQLHLVLGFVNDKDLKSMLEIMPADAHYYFCAAHVPRSMDPQRLFEQAREFGLKGIVVPDTNQALKAARSAASNEDIIFVGGSTFVVAEINELN
jgi:dihydrofolate synthase/folylpolyglutamate synthase